MFLTTNAGELDKVKSFLDKTVSELQTSANQYSEGNKNPVETIANDLKSKFEEFLSQFKTK